jgi:hypothetical protein
MYLTNDQRIRLGLQHFGSDVPDAVVAAAEAALAGAAPVAATDSAPTKKRARTVKGQFEGDDPATPEVNEAFAEG